MRYQAVLLDAFGTTVQIGDGKHPYRLLLREGIRQGRRPKPDDAQALMKLNGGIPHAAEQLGIKVAPSRLAELQDILEEEVSGIEAFPDALEAVALLQEHGRLIAICSNLAFPYGVAVKRLFPTMNAFGFSFEAGVTKPDPRMYRQTCQMLGVEPGHITGDNRIIMIGDSLRCDCHGPRAVGIAGVHLNRASPVGIRDLMDFARLVLNES
ncbi:haloacid dehalogenase [Pseudomonas syringae group genomosp. 3]|uniref:Haloacid dehalogenase n=1 Tax=Pseudomonas syringae group genomosp. 3 TaxID=251701 RepID=A0A2K4WJV3_9PSED|nr:HAD family hydrolase [Pseudomonas syringae group genomosp. 3]SOS36173.1 haloacid dehalogenase [Pseudomonas syringae group genomosp. 3]